VPRVARHWSQPGVQPDVARYINHGGCPNAFTKVVTADTVKHACHPAAARVLDATKRSRGLQGAPTSCRWQPPRSGRARRAGPASAGCAARRPDHVRWQAAAQARCPLSGLLCCRLPVHLVRTPSGTASGVVHAQLQQLPPLRGGCQRLPGRLGLVIVRVSLRSARVRAARGWPHGCHCPWSRPWWTRWVGSCG